MSRPLATVFLALLFGFTGACSDSDGDGRPDLPAVPTDFAAADASLDAFVAEHPGFSGASLVVVDRHGGVVHRHYAGDYTEDTVILLASTSKMPSVSLLMALAADDDNVDFEIDRVIDDYLPWQGVWPGRTVEHLVSNTSGMPGLGDIGAYGPHICQYLPAGHLLDCAETIFTTPLDHLETFPPGTRFRYGGSPWQLAGAVAEVVGGASWNQLFDRYIAEPCELEVFTYGNALSSAERWDGNPDGLVGRDNPNIEGGAISNQGDYAKILAMHLNGGRCGDTQVLTPEGAAFMRIDRAWATGAVDRDELGYGMGWWVVPPEEAGAEPSLFVDPGAFGALSWIDTERGYGGFMAIQSDSLLGGGEATGYGIAELVPLVQAAYDAVGR